MRKIICCILFLLGMCVFTGNDIVEAKTEGQIKLNRTEVEKYQGKGFSLNLIGAPDSKVSWKSGNKKIAAISEDGFVSCIRPGKTVLSATYKGKKYTCSLTVIKPYISSAKKICEIGDSFKIKICGSGEKSYEIKDETVAKVSSSGRIKTLRAGKTKLTVTGTDGKKYSCKIYVYDTARWQEPITIKSKNCKFTSKIKAKDVPNESFSVNPGTLVNFTTILYKSGTPENLVYLRNSGVTKLLSYRDYDCRLQKAVIGPLSRMLEDAYKEGKYKYSIISGGGYRTYAKQDGYWNRRLGMVPSYGDDPYNNGGVICVPAVSSEHRTGYAIDFDATASAFKWLEKNSYKYGFIHRYVGKKTKITGVMDEDLHYTYVGKEIAATCYYENLCLEEYYEKYVNVDPVGN